MKFSDLGLVEPILRSLHREGYENPTPIQAQAIPDIVAGRDMLGCAQTGTGKTAAFALPILHRLFQKHHGESRHLVRCLVLAPTRELALQIDESFQTYGRHLGLRHAVMFGGVSQHGQVQAIRKGVDILVATPGRLLDLVNQRLVNLSKVEVLVLDEADRMLDMGFIHDIRKVVALVPKQRQTLMFSATMPPDIRQLAGTILHNPSYVEVARVASTLPKIDQSVYFVERKYKPQLLAHLINNTAISRALIFTRTKHGADRVVRQLHQAGIRAEAIHGNKTQNARQRALTNFKSGKTPILIASDIASRGIDVDDISHVFNYDLTHEPETYVHRIGRTGRAGAEGHAISFCDVDERQNLMAIERLIRQKIRVNEEHPAYAKQQEHHRHEARHAQHPRSNRRPQHSGGSRGNSHPQRNAERHPSHRSNSSGNGSTIRQAATSAPSQHAPSRHAQPQKRQQPGRPRAKHPLDRSQPRKYTNHHAKHR